VTTFQEDIDAFLSSQAAEAGAITPLACPLVWAKDANTFDCVRFLSLKSLGA